MNSPPPSISDSCPGTLSKCHDILGDSLGALHSSTGGSTLMAASSVGNSPEPLQGSTFGSCPGALSNCSEILSDSLGALNNSPTALHGSTGVNSLTAATSVGNSPEILHGHIGGNSHQAASSVGNSPEALHGGSSPQPASPDACSIYPNISSNCPDALSNYPEALSNSPVPLHSSSSPRGSSPGAISSVGNSPVATDGNPVGDGAVHSTAHGCSLKPVAITGACSASSAVVVRRSERLGKQPSGIFHAC